jgi:nucleoside 2-deoxyribosyltransferase
MKLYLGGPMFTAAEVHHNLRLAARLRHYGFHVYCPNENASINDKTKTNISPEKVYQADIKEVEDSNVFVCQVSEDSGTMWEAGYMDCLSKHVNSNRYLGSIGLATDIRLLTMPDPEHVGVENQAFHINAFITGGLKLSLGIYLNEDTMIQRLLALDGREPLG